MIRFLLPCVVVLSLLGPLRADRKDDTYSPGMHAVDITTLKPLSLAEGTVPGAVYADPEADPADRARDLIGRMTFEEKLAMTGGWNRFLVSGVPRLGIRPVSMADASQGLRLQTTLVKSISTSYPGMLPMASTWNRDLMASMAASIADECRVHGVDILLGPGLNIQRLSVGGRGYEYFGEDPFLAAEMGVAYIRSLQEAGIIACPKHFIANDQDFCRHITNYEVDERTLREIYLLPWERAVTEAHTLGIMTGNNLVNGYQCFMNRDLLTGVLRKDFGFDGLIMTDWQNTNYYPDLQRLALSSGGSLLMPDNTTFKQAVDRWIAEDPDARAGIEQALEEMVFPTFYALFKMGVYDRPFQDLDRWTDVAEHQRLAAECATEAVVLLKNEGGILPLRQGTDILLMGAEESSSGTGSGFVAGYDHVSIADGLCAIYGDKVTVSENPSDDAVRAAGVVLFRLNKPAGEGYDVPFDSPEDQIARLREVVRLNDNVVVLVNACNSLPMDWSGQAKGIVWCYFLGQERGTAIASLLSGQQNFSGKLPITLEKDFADGPDPTFNYLGGKPYWKGNNQYKDYWLGLSPDERIAGFSEYVRPGEVLSRPYGEGVFIGYRWADRTDMPCYYHFGEGLSYTTFEYVKMKVRRDRSRKGKVHVSVTLRNTGDRAGKEVVQLYVRDLHPKVERPEKELKAFEKVLIQPHREAVVRFELDEAAFRYWDADGHAWTVSGDGYEILAGGSSHDLPLTKRMNL